MYIIWCYLLSFFTFLQNKEVKINKGEHRSRKAAPITFNNRKNLIPIPKQIGDEEHDRKQTKHN